jgi:hypothetical protein
MGDVKESSLVKVIMRQATGDAAETWRLPP